MKNLQEYLEESRNPQLAQAVLDQMGLDFEEVIERPSDFRDASAGVSGFIYYSETTQFAKDNLLLITMTLNEFEEEIGSTLSKPKEDETQYLNWLAWFALETVIDEIMTLTE